MKTISFVLCFLFVSLAAQTQNNKILLLKHKQKTKFKFIKPGKKVSYWYEDNRNIKNKGRITRIQDSLFFIDGKAIIPEDLSKIAAKTTGHTLASFAGGAVVATGTLISGTGIVLILNSKDDNSCEGTISFVVGVLAAASGAAIIAVGSVPLIIGGKRYDLYHDWDLIITEEIGRKKMKQKLKSGDFSNSD